LSIACDEAEVYAQAARAAHRAWELSPPAIGTSTI
jgi:hypothetical protein